MVHSHWHVIVVDRVVENRDELAVCDAWLLTNEIFLPMSCQSALHKLAEITVKETQLVNCSLVCLSILEDLGNQVLAIVLHVVFNCLKDRVHCPSSLRVIAVEPTSITYHSKDSI